MYVSQYPNEKGEIRGNRKNMVFAALHNKTRFFFVPNLTPTDWDIGTPSFENPVTMRPAAVPIPNVIRTAFMHHVIRF
jgi:hypothetical protein